MKLIRRFLNISLAGCMLLSTSTGAHAVDYSFSTESASDYYSSTSYEDAYGSQYNYATTSTGGGYGVGTGTPVIADIPGINEFPTCPQPAYTSADGMKRSDGSIGTLKIPSLGINMKVWEGETNSSMRKGLGHYSSTSAWDGNVGVCGHNRGTKYVIGSIKDLETGDTITYTTIYGTRTYSVSMVKIIDSTDWSYLQATTDNRVALTTCLANQPNKRVCVQAVQVNG